MRSISYNFGAATLSRVVVNFLGVVIVGILTRALGPSGFGHYSTAMAYLFIFSILADMGLHAILVREISQDSSQENEIFNKIFTLRLFLVVFFVGFAIALVWLLPYEYVVKMGVTIASAYIVLSSLVQIMLGVFQKHLKVYLVSIADIIMRATQLGLLLLLVISDNVGLLLFFVIVVVAEIIHFAVTLFFLKRTLHPKLIIDKVYWKTILKKSFPIAASLVFTILYFRMDTVFLSLLRSPEEVGIYSVGYKILELVIFIPALYIGLIMPLLSKYGKKNMGKFAEVFKKSFNNLSILAFPAVVYLYMLSPSITGLVGGDVFIISGDVLKILVVAVFMIFFGNLGGNALVALDLQKKGMWIYLFGAVFNVTTNLIFIPQYGYIAAAWTTVLTEIIVTVAMFYVILRFTKFELSLGIPLRALLASGVMGVFIYPFINHLLVATIIATLYFPILWLLGGISKGDIKKALLLRA